MIMVNQEYVSFKSTIKVGDTVQYVDRINHGRTGKVLALESEGRFAHVLWNDRAAQGKTVGSWHDARTLERMEE